MRIYSREELLAKRTIVTKKTLSQEELKELRLAKQLETKKAIRSKMNKVHPSLGQKNNSEMDMISHMNMVTAGFGSI